MLIRPIEKKDKEKLLPMMVEFYNSPALLHHTTAEVLEKVIDDCVSDLPFAEGYVCVSEAGDIVGYTMISKGYSTEYGGVSIMIEDLYVDEKYRDRHVGTGLLKFIESKFAGTAVRLRLEVEPNNQKAISLYRKMGYNEIGYKQMSKEI